MADQQQQPQPQGTAPAANTPPPQKPVNPQMMQALIAALRGKPQQVNYSPQQPTMTIGVRG